MMDDSGMNSPEREVMGLVLILMVWNVNQIQFPLIPPSVQTRCWFRATFCHVPLDTRWLGSNTVWVRIRLECLTNQMNCSLLLRKNGSQIEISPLKIKKLWRPSDKETEVEKKYTVSVCSTSRLNHVRTLTATAVTIAPRNPNENCHFTRTCKHCANFLCK